MRNTVIEAGAGTGKTTRLVKVVLEALFTRGIRLQNIVALTFTKKAAGELKDRVAQALHAVTAAGRLEELKTNPWWPDPAVGLDDLKTLSAQALTVIDRAEISTIHSFAFSILKRFPLAAHIDPSAEIDDKNLKFDTLFRREWPRWLAAELAEGAPRESDWLKLLETITLSDLQEAARELADFKLPLEGLPLSDADLTKRLAELHAEAKELVATHPGDLNADKVAQACEATLIPQPPSPLSMEKGAKPSPYSRERAGAEGDWVRVSLNLKPGSPKSWSATDLKRLTFLQSVAKNLLAGGDQVVARATTLLKPFITTFRSILLKEGVLTHSGLLYLSRDLVRDHLAIRDVLKRDIRLILIDEFQDTDPLQAELLVFLCEKAGLGAKEWRRVHLEDGKLTIVGDPKQSIYLFRGADIAAYEEVCQMVLAQGGMQEPLKTNYRSQAQILHWVNDSFKQLIQPVPRVSPPYVAVEPHHPHDPDSPLHDVEIWIAGSDEKQSVEDAQATEAEAIAEWIEEHTRQHRVARRDIALIFRTYSPMDRYIDALRRRNIPYIVESERYFYTTPEVTDMINLLHAADDPADDLSLIGYLRSPMAGHTDEDILRHRQASTLESLESVREVRQLGERLLREPLSRALRHLFEDTYLLEIYSRSYHGDQTIANLEKLRRLLEGFAAEGVTTMGLLLKKLQEFFKDDTLEGENPLSDENYDAVKLMTIHKAKGLEFPVVFLPSLHSELSRHREGPFQFDWRTERGGLAIAGKFRNLDKLLLEEQTREREQAEVIRLLYVAMTRPKHRLILSGGTDLKVNKSGTFLRRLGDAWGISISEAAEGQISRDGFTLSIKHLAKAGFVAEKPRQADGLLIGTIDPSSFEAIWKERAKECAEAKERAVVITPTSAMSYVHSAMRHENRRVAHSRINLADSSSRALGTLLHLFLEHWDFTCEKCSMPAMLTRTAKPFFAQQGLPYDEALMLEARHVLADFIGSEAWAEIKNSEILGRELPFFYRTPEGALMRGTMDILYRTPDGKLVIGDYKSGNSELGTRNPERQYGAQAQAYQQAVKLALGEDATFKIISLREGIAVVQ